MSFELLIFLGVKPEDDEFELEVDSDLHELKGDKKRSSPFRSL